MRRAFLILLAVSQIGAARLHHYGPPQWDRSAEPVSLIALIARPSEYDGRKVRVDGYLSLHFEGTGLYPDRAAFEARLSRNAIWIDKPAGLDLRNERSLDRRYATVEGRFVANPGLPGVFSGTLTDVRRIAPLLTKAERVAAYEADFWVGFWRDPRLWFALAFVIAVPGAVWVAMGRRRRA